MKNRSREEILEAFMNAINDVGHKGMTAILRRSNYEYDNGKGYIEWLLANNLVETNTVENKMFGYNLTDAGRQYLRYLTAQNMLMNSDEQSK